MRRPPDPRNRERRSAGTERRDLENSSNTDTLKRIDPKAQPLEPSLYEMARSFYPGGPFCGLQYDPKFHGVADVSNYLAHLPLEVIRRHEEGEIEYIDEFVEGTLRQMYWRAMGRFYFGDLPFGQNAYAVLFDRAKSNGVPWRVSQLQPHIAATWLTEGSA
jgi:hypothetical protein